jgi:methylmalonyl-CoA mutase N-terminal domain/subunit
MATTEDRSEVGGGTEEWREKLYEAAPERQGELFSTISGLENEPLYTPDTVEIDYDRAPRLRASSVYARGYPSMYRGRLWTMRQFAGFGTAEETNERFRYLPATNRPALTAFDMPPDGLRPDHPRSLGEVGREGGGDCWPTWRRSSRASLGEVSTSMTINGPAAMLSPLRLRRRAAGYAPSSAGRSDGHPQVHRAEGVDASAGAVDAL